MAHGYGITGWSGGSRVPLTYNLKAGQFRGARGVNIFPSHTIVNNYGYDRYADSYGDDNDMPKWMQWMMGLGMGTQLLGGIFSMFCGGGGARASKSAESDNKGVLSAADTQTLAGLRSDFGDYVKIGDPYGDGSITVKDKETGAMTRYADLNAVKIALESKYANKASDGNNPSTKNAEVVETGMKRYVSGKLSGANVNNNNITCEYKNGEYVLKYTDDDGNSVNVEYDSFDNFKKGVDNVIANGTHNDAQNSVINSNTGQAGAQNLGGGGNSTIASGGNASAGANNTSNVASGGGSTDRPVNGQGSNNNTTNTGDNNVNAENESHTSSTGAAVQGQGDSNNQPTTITITKGSGVIAAINNALNGKKIKSGNEQKVMNLLINNSSGVTSRLQNGQVDMNGNFYKGSNQIGSKGNYGFVVQPGQTITIPLNVWTEIEKLAQ